MSVSLSNESIIKVTAGLVDSLVDTAGYHHARLVDLDESEIGHYHPDKPVVELLTAGYFALAIETQGILNELCVIEKTIPPSTLLSRVPDDIRKRIIGIAKRKAIMIDSSVLKAVPFVPLRERKVRFIPD